MANLSYGHKFLKFLLIALNFLAVCCGIALLIVGVLALLNLKKFLGTENVQFHALIYFIIALGGFLSILGTLGFCGACRENKCCLVMYMFLLAIFIVAGVGAGIAAFVFGDKVQNYMSSITTEAYEFYGKESSHYDNFIDLVQKELQCCGANGTWDTVKSGPVPDSCLNAAGDVYTSGCLNAVKAFFKKYMLIAALCVFLFALLQILSLIFAICLRQALSHVEFD
ncbi:23 kDa integral membrane protein [Clonorchis sinensis]|uniref:Tetraspanin n=1 Tax=Clonorchis sinensis TaxID=79923 RepID=A0A8T1MX01_CLOSI|nr:23 kDa integral membrane protein [Clonorchis sinensis]